MYLLNAYVLILGSIIFYSVKYCATIIKHKIGLKSCIQNKQLYTSSIVYVSDFTASYLEAWKEVTEISWQTGQTLTNPETNFDTFILRTYCYYLNPCIPQVVKQRCMKMVFRREGKKPKVIAACSLQSTSTAKGNQQKQWQVTSRILREMFENHDSLVSTTPLQQPRHQHNDETHLGPITQSFFNCLHTSSINHSSHDDSSNDCTLKCISMLSLLSSTLKLQIINKGNSRITKIFVQ